MWKIYIYSSVTCFIWIFKLRFAKGEEAALEQFTVRTGHNSPRCRLSPAANCEKWTHCVLQIWISNALLFWDVSEEFCKCSERGRQVKIKKFPRFSMKSAFPRFWTFWERRRRHVEPEQGEANYFVIDVTKNYYILKIQKKEVAALSHIYPIEFIYLCSWSHAGALIYWSKVKTLSLLRFFCGWQ